MSSENFVKLYKNDGKPDDLRRRRTETSVELRKQKGNDEMMKRRNLNVDLEDESFTSGGSDAEDTGAAGDTGTPGRGGAALPPLMTMEEAVASLQENPSTEQVRAAFEAVRRTLSRNKDPPIDHVIKLGFPFALVQALNLQDEKVQFEAAWALTNIVSGTSEQTLAVINAGAIKPLLNLCASPSPKLAEQAVWAIANIAGDGVKLRDQLIAEGVVPLFLELTARLDKLQSSFVRILAWAMSNICRHKKPPVPHPVLAQLAPAIGLMLQYDDLQTQADACWALSYLTDGADENIQLALPMVSQVVGFACSAQDALISPALRVLGNFATGNDELTQVVIDSGILTSAVSQLLMSKNSAFVKECCWLVSNVLAGNPQQIQEVIDAQLLPLMLRVLEKGEHKCQYEAGWAVANLTHGGTASQLLEICRIKNGVEAICSCLGVKNNELVANMLDALYNLLSAVAGHDHENLAKVCDRVEECGGLDKLEMLQQHESEKIYNTCYKIIEEFFSDEEEEGLVLDGGVEVPSAGGGEHKSLLQQQQMDGQQFNF